MLIPGCYSKWLHYWLLPSRPPDPPAPTLASTFSLPPTHHLRESLGGNAVPGGAPEPARLGPGLTLHEGWRVLLTALADRGGEDGGLVPDHGERGRGKWTARGEWVLRAGSKGSGLVDKRWIILGFLKMRMCCFLPSSWADTKCSWQRPDAHVSESPAVLPPLPTKCGECVWSRDNTH